MHAVRRFGGSETQGQVITLTQSDKWLRQAGVLDTWTITTIDTAIAFRLLPTLPTNYRVFTLILYFTRRCRVLCRRVSRGSIYLGFSSWRQFLEEFVSRAGLELERVTEQLEQCGAPSHTHTTQIQQRSSTASHAHLGRRLAAR